MFFLWYYCSFTGIIVLSQNLENLQTLFLNNPVFFSQYLAPEVLKKQPYDKTVDWWCLGAVLYEMMYGLPPFYSRDTAEMYDNILYKPLRLRTNVSASARSITVLS
jgi:serine/threonine protein kinase